MRMRSIWTSGVVAIGSIAVGATSAGADQITWDLSTFARSGSAWASGVEFLAEQVEERSDGNFVINRHYSEALSPAREKLDGLQIGAFEMAMFCTSYHPGKNPIGTVLDLPFLPHLHSLEETRQVHETFRTHPKWMAELARWNAQPYFASFLPRYEFMGIGEPPEELEGWSGRRVRALGGMGEAMRRLGAVPTTVPAPEVYTAMERRIFDAASWPFSYTFGLYQLHDIADWYTYNIAVGSAHCSTAVNLDAYAALPDEYQQLLDDIRPEAYDVMIQTYRDADAEWIPIYDEQLTRVTYSDEQIERFREMAAEPVWDEWVAEMEGKGVPGREMLDFVLQAAEEARSLAAQ